MIWRNPQTIRNVLGMQKVTQKDAHVRLMMARDRVRHEQRYGNESAQFYADMSACTALAVWKDTGA